MSCPLFCRAGRSELSEGVEWGEISALRSEDRLRRGMSSSGAISEFRQVGRKIRRVDGGDGSRGFRGQPRALFAFARHAGFAGGGMRIRKIGRTAEINFGAAFCEIFDNI